MSARLLLIAFTLCASPVLAQSGSKSLGETAAPASLFSRAGSTYASTAIESKLNGLAALESATAQGELARAHASLVREQARTLALQNRYEATQLRQKLEQSYDDRRQRSLAEKADRLAARQLRRIAERQTLVASRWPAALQTDRYEPLRDEVEGLIALQNRLGRNASSVSVALQAALHEFAEQVRIDAKDNLLSPQQYAKAKRFVRRIPDRYLHADMLLGPGGRKTMLAMTEN